MRRVVFVVMLCVLLLLAGCAPQMDTAPSAAAVLPSATTTAQAPAPQETPLPDLEKLVRQYDIPCADGYPIVWSEQTAFAPILCEPDVLLKTIDGAGADAEKLADAFDGMGLPFIRDDLLSVAQGSFYSHCYQDIPVGGKNCTLYLVMQEMQDTCIFVFVEDEDGCALVDVLCCFNEVAFVTDDSEDNTWLMGYTWGHGTGVQSYDVGWYNLKTRRMEVRYVTDAYESHKTYTGVKNATPPIIETTPADADVKRYTLLLDDTQHALVKTGFRLFDMEAYTNENALPVQLYTYGQVDLYRYSPAEYALTLEMTKRYDNIEPTALEYITPYYVLNAQ